MDVACLDSRCAGARPVLRRERRAATETKGPPKGVPPDTQKIPKSSLHHMSQCAWRVRLTLRLGAKCLQIEHSMHGIFNTQNESNF